jgi:hypothetical protein
MDEFSIAFASSNARQDNEVNSEQVFEVDYSEAISRCECYQNFSASD